MFDTTLPAIWYEKLIRLVQISASFPKTHSDPGVQVAGPYGSSLTIWEEYPFRLFMSSKNNRFLSLKTLPHEVHYCYIFMEVYSYLPADHYYRKIGY